MGNSLLHPCPKSWYLIGRTDSLAVGQHKTFYVADEPLLVYRTAQGRVVATDAHCPHLGASFASAGAVVGEELQCRMHGFCYNASGACTRTGSGNRPPAKARLRTRPTIERNGFLLVWYAEDHSPPMCQIPTLDLTGFSSLRSKTYRFRGHPQETTENSVDLGHLQHLHQYRDVEITSPLRTDGAYLTAAFVFSRRADFFGRRDDLRVFYTVHVHGFGYSFVDVSVPAFGFRTQQFVLTRPIQAGQIELMIAIRARPIKSPSSMAAQVAHRGLSELLALTIMQGFKADIGKDIPVWADKRFLPRPALSEGEGLIGAYRRWSRQFYPGASEESPAEVG